MKNENKNANVLLIYKTWAMLSSIEVEDKLNWSSIDFFNTGTFKIHTKSKSAHMKVHNVKLNWILPYIL